MTYAGDRIVYDADSHLMELPDFLIEHADTKTAAKLADLPGVLKGQFAPGASNSARGHDTETVDRLLALGDGLTRGPKWHSALGAFNGRERGLALDLLGFRRQVVFSSFCGRLIFGAQDLDTAYATAAAHNRAMAAFCAADERLLGVAMVPLDDPVRALAEIEAARELGLRSVWISAEAPGDRAPGHPAHDAIWATLADAGMPFILHVGSAELAVSEPWMNDGHPERKSARGGAEVIGSKDLTVIHFPMQRFISVLVLDGVLDRFPSLRGGVIEVGAGWVPDMIRRLDHAVDIWAKSEPHLATLSRKPSEQITAQLRFTPYPFENVAQLVSESNADLYMFSSDYPHAEGGRDPIGRFARATAALDAEAREKFFAGNFRNLYRV